MEELIQSIYQTLDDYRADENQQSLRVTPASILEWIIQFQEPDRIPILKELDKTFKERYYSKERTKELLITLIEILTKDYKFENEKDFLANAIFLNMQPAGKSQSVMLNILDAIIKEKYSLSIDECGSISKKYQIYLDDILCTGLTLINDTKKWAEAEYSTGKTNKDAIEQNLTKLIFVYIFIHEKNYILKVKQMHFTSKHLPSNQKMYRDKEIENSITGTSKIDLIMPIEENIQSVINYKNDIIALVDDHTKGFTEKKSPEEFYRPANKPDTELFFTSAENRKIVERAFLNKGIEILNAANTTNKNIRALGYSIPSHKNFGFGALCFTWRNVPNNAPLVFWYLGGGFTPLFKVQRGNTDIIDLNALFFG